MFNVSRLATGLVLSLAVATTPLAARDWHGGGGYNRGYHGGYRHHGGIGVGGALLGAAIIGGIAIAASNRDRTPVYDGYRSAAPAYGYDQSSGYEQQGYGGGYDARAGADPVGACGRELDRVTGQRGDRARVAGVDGVTPYDGGSTVRGTVAIETARGSETRGFSCNASYEGEARVRIG